MRPAPGAHSSRLHESWSTLLRAWSASLLPSRPRSAGPSPLARTGTPATATGDRLDSRPSVSGTSAATMCLPAEASSGPPAPVGSSSFSINATSGAARAGVVSTPHGDIPTPASLLYTRQGSPMHLVPDTVDKLREKGQVLQLNAMHFLNFPGGGPIALFGRGARGFMALGEGPLVGTARDALDYEFSARSTDAGVLLNAHFGRTQVSPEQYLDVLAILQLDIIALLTDELPAGAGGNRRRTGERRSLRWLDECLRSIAGRPALAATSCLAPVGGSTCPGTRKRWAAAVVARCEGEPHVLGYCATGFGTGESEDEGRAMLAASVGELPQGALRMASGISTPHQMLEAIESGIDLFDTAFSTAAAAAGLAFVFPLAPTAGSATRGLLNGVTSGDGSPGQNGTGVTTAGEAPVSEQPFDLDLADTRHRLDKSPLLEGCSCYACTHHSRGYLHHLVQSEELLVSLLLELHNSHHLLAWFDAIRTAVAGDVFPEYVAWFQGNVARPAAVTAKGRAPQQPRVYTQV